MTSFLVQLIVAVVILCVALWGIRKLAPPDLEQVLRVIAVGAFLVWLVMNGLPLLGVL